MHGNDKCLRRTQSIYCASPTTCLVSLLAWPPPDVQCTSNYAEESRTGAEDWGQPKLCKGMDARIRWAVALTPDIGK